MENGETAKLNRYEAMFIFSQTHFRDNKEHCRAEVSSIIEKSGGSVEYFRLWSERAMTYEIKKVRMASYVLAYFLAPPENVGKIERAISISDSILRCMIISPERDFEESILTSVDDDEGQQEKAVEAGLESAVEAK